MFLGGGDDVVDARGDAFDDDYIDGGDGFDTLFVRTGFARSNLFNLEAIIGNLTGRRARPDRDNVA